jgi:Tfp pilus assembly major pilin PilA
VTIDDQIWIGQNGEKYGPYPEATVRQWLAEGKFAADALAWREGMAAWVPLSSLFSTTAGREQPRQPPPGFLSIDDTRAVEPFSAQRYAPVDPVDAERAELPMPPSLHWGLLLLFTVISFGIFGIIWPFFQAGWVRKIDDQSKATLLLALAFIACAVGEVLYFSGIRSLATGGGGLTGLGGLLMLCYWILYLVAYFSMAASMRRALIPIGLPVEIGGITLFFFNMYYLQGQLSWVARWKHTGQTEPKASKGVFWILLVLPVFMIAILAAIAVPAYQGYVIRAQVSEGMVLSNGAKAAFTEYYSNRHAVPPDNTAAGLDPSSSITGKYVSGVDVSGGKITVAFDNAAANVTIRGKVLVLTPTLGNGPISWSCNAESTVPERDLPMSCRR